MHEPTGVIVVEDEAATRESLINAISGTDNMVVLAAVGTLEEAREAVETVPPRALIVDLKLPDGSGIDLIRYVHRHRPNVDVMVVSILGDAPTVLEAIEAGATSYILKDATGPDIVTALREMLAARSSGNCSKRLHRTSGRQPPSH
jgi:DNA-binding NarL/FixJ family response regulator